MISFSHLLCFQKCQKNSKSCNLNLLQAKTRTILFQWFRWIWRTNCVLVAIFRFLWGWGLEHSDLSIWISCTGIHLCPLEIPSMFMKECRTSNSCQWVCIGLNWFSFLPVLMSTYFMHLLNGKALYQVHNVFNGKAIRNVFRPSLHFSIMTEGNDRW